MIIKVASTNEVKVSAVREVIQFYDFLRESEVVPVKVPSGVSEQPKSLEETVRGARNRAIASFVDCDYSFGIESGLFEVPYSLTGYLDLCTCVIYDGDLCGIGLSSAFECPPDITQFMIEEGLDMNDACNKAGLTTNPKLGSAEGAVGILTGGRVLRKEYTKQAVIMALVHLENATMYGMKSPSRI
jgi:inosine/xanthosine triphosphatase